MRILFDSQTFTMQTHGGISRCFVELYKNLPKDIEARFSVYESDNVYIKELVNVNPKGYIFDHFICRYRFPGKWRLHVWTDRFRKHKYYPEYNNNRTIEELQKGDFDIFHPTFFGDYFLPYLQGKPFVMTIHDMIPELYPQYFRQDDFQIVMKRELAPLANAIIAVSENTKSDIIKLLGIPKEKIHVIYHGCSLPTPAKALRPFTFPYILFVGNRLGYKNFFPFVKGITPVLKRHQGLHVVCTGGPFHDKENAFLEETGFKERFIHQWIANDEDLFSLYHHAVCFIYPSEYEGFGIPILEAYQADCPVMLNRRSCFPEIAGDAAVYFNMDASHNDIEEHLENLLSMSGEEKAHLLDKQRERLTHFSWKQSALQLAQVYKSLI